MTKKSSETFKEYVQRWRELVARVEPPLHEKEITIMFIETLQTPFYEHVLGSVSSNFSDIVTIRKRIEHGLKIGKIAQGSFAATKAKKPGFNFNTKERDVQTTFAMPYQGGSPHQYRPNYRPSSTYVVNTIPNYQHNVPRLQPTYRPPFTLNNAYQPNAGGQNSN